MCASVFCRSPSRKVDVPGGARERQGWGIYRYSGPKMNCEFFLGVRKGEGRREREEGREVDNGAEVYKGEKKSTANFPTNVELMTPTGST